MTHPLVLQRLLRPLALAGALAAGLAAALPARAAPACLTLSADALVVLQRCGGNVFHASRAETLAMVDSLRAFQNRRYNSTHGVAASDWLAERWRTLIPANRRDARVLQITHAGWPLKSVMVEILGNTHPHETVVLGGHLDSIAPGNTIGSHATGADDNANGIADPAEEVGPRGSGGIAADFLGRAEKVVGVMQLDMTTFQGDSTDIRLYTDYTNAAQNAFLAALVSRYLPGSTVGHSAFGYACSDHASWHTRGFRASLPHEASNADHNCAIDTVNDVTATFGNDPQHMLRFTKLALVYAVELGTLPRGTRGALAAR